MEIMMVRLFNNLSEKDQRHYASIEAAKLGHGGIKYISELFDIDPKTINSGLDELKKMPLFPEDASDGRAVGVRRMRRKDRQKHK